MRARAPWPTVGLVSLLVLLVDQVAKALVVRAVPEGTSLPLLPGVVALTRVHNTGIAFGLFRHAPVLLTALVALVVVVAVGAHWLRAGRTGPTGRAERLGTSLVLGGAAGNLLDRLRLGYVVDYVDLHVWPVFNLADAAVVVGAALLLLTLRAPAARGTR